MKPLKTLKEVNSLPNNIVIPSTKLKSINVHKLQDSMTCSRLYFWTWIYNLTPNRLQMPFWFGSCMHRAFEKLNQLAGLQVAIKEMQKESRKILKNLPLSGEELIETKLQLKVAETILNAYYDLYGVDHRKGKVITEKSFNILLPISRCDFTGRLDAYRVIKTNNILDEYKTATRISNDYFARLLFDKQINGYAKGVEHLTGTLPRYCNYWVIRKPTIRLKKEELPDEYIRRLKIDIYTRPEFYFIKEKVTFTKANVNAVMQDIDQEAFDLKCKFDFYNEKELLKPINWPRNDRACFNFGCCKFMPLCKAGKSYPLWLRLYKQRDIRYKNELNELSFNNAIDSNMPAELMGNKKISKAVLQKEIRKSIKSRKVKK
jgi:hypothetical protein